MEKVKLREKIGYGLGDAASSMFWKLFTMYLLFFYTDIVGISSAVIGTMFLITRIWDTFLDPFIGVVGDRTMSRWGKFRPYLLFGAIPFALCGALTFTSIDGTETAKIIYAYATYTLMMMVYSTVNVPYASLLGVMSANSQERNSLSSYRMTFAFGGSILVLLLIEPLVDIFSHMRLINGLPSLNFGWQMAAVVFAIIAAGMFFLTFLWTKERVKPLHNNEKSSLKSDIKDLANNKPWWILLAAGIMALVFNSLRDGSAIFYFKYYVNASDAFTVSFFNSSITLITIYLVIGQAANILGIMVMPSLTRLMGKKKTFLSAMLFATVFSVLFYFLPKTFIWGILGLQTLISVCAGIISPLLWSMYADISDFSEWKTGRRATGLIFSSSSMSQKFGWTIGGALTGWLLAYFGFKANVIQSDFALMGINLMMSIFPAIATILSVVFISLYPLTEKRTDQISSELSEKRSFEHSTN